MKSDSQRNVYYDSDQWKELRKKAIKRADYRCQLCNYEPEDYTQWLEVHHRTYLNWKRETLDDLIVLCRDCHWLFHKTHWYCGGEFANNRRRFQAIAKWKD